MRKVILVDGNNILYRSYFATAYTGSLMRNAQGFPTNALYGFVNMINKIIVDENPEYMVVAFDKGKTFRHEKYDSYKGTRDETPSDLKLQFPRAKDILEAMGIVWIDVDNYEADDIIGTIAKMIDFDDKYIGTIVSSDRDLLQLISDDVDVKLLKSKGFVRYNVITFKKEYELEPIKIIDLKALQGDSSDNIPGVKGIGEKTALKLIREFSSITNLYDNIFDGRISNSIRMKLESDRRQAFMSKDLATIYRDIDLKIELEDLKIKDEDVLKMSKIYQELGFNSLLKKLDLSGYKTEEVVDDEIIVIQDINELNEDEYASCYIEFADDYFNPTIKAVGLFNLGKFYYIDGTILIDNYDFLEKVRAVYDLKRSYVGLNKYNVKWSKVKYDITILRYLLNYLVKIDQEFDQDLVNKCYKASKLIYQESLKLSKEIEKQKLNELYYNIELPLAIVLGKMELTGINVDKVVLSEMGVGLEKDIDNIRRDIYTMCGEEFNLNSPSQLSKVLFEHLDLPPARKLKTGFSTDNNVLIKLRGKHPIIDKILEYRKLSKLLNTYIVSLTDYIKNDGKIHTIYNQTLTRTGRLSSMNPNLQNIPIKTEEGKMIRKAFLPSENCLIMSCDYSQIELRVFAHISHNKEFIMAFNNGEDIHTKTAMDIFGIKADEVTQAQRRKAKAVNFGIIYGISAFGLSEQLNINPKVAKEFLDQYFKVYPGIKVFMDEMIKTATMDGYVTTIMNRRRVIEELNNKNHAIKNMGQRMALNTPIQGSSADILKKAMVEIDKVLTEKKMKSKMILQVHDELIFDCDQEELVMLKKVVTNIMENTYKLSVPLKIDVNIGINWYDAK